MASFGQPGSLVPPGSVLIDVLPAILLFGVGISLVVAPLTSTLMSSVPVRNSGLASAINNAISRIGQPLLNAVIFIVISATFYGGLASRVPGLDANSADVRRDVPPLNVPAQGVSSEVAAAAKEASTDAFHLAVIVAGALLVAGAAVNFVGLRGTAGHGSADERTAEAPPAAGG